MANQPKNQLEQDAFTTEELNRIRDTIKEKYRAVSLSATGYFKYPVGREGAEALGYDNEILHMIPDDILSSFCGVGNPFVIKLIGDGCVVLDVGCGAGVDLYVASRLIGPEGRAYGVDLTEEMVRRAQMNMRRLGAGNVEVRPVDSEQLPFADATFDVVISNGVINLSPDKAGLFGEIHRVLKAGDGYSLPTSYLSREHRRLRLMSNPGRNE